MAHSTGVPSFGFESVGECDADDKCAFASLKRERVPCGRAGTLPEALEQKFESLKQRRKHMGTTTSPDLQSPTVSTETAHGCLPTDETNVDEHKWKLQTSKELELLNSCMQQTFDVCDVYDPHSAKKSKLEQQIDEAIDRGKFAEAEALNDELSKRDLAKRVTGAFQAGKFLETRRLKAETKMAQRRKKVKWLFDSKQRWEMKGNM